jgi:hypothetical protein
MVLRQKMYNHRYGCKKVGEAIGIGSGSLVMLELLASANDWLPMLLTLKTQIKNLKNPHSFNTTVIITVYRWENGNKKKCWRISALGGYILSTFSKNFAILILSYFWF